MDPGQTFQHHVVARSQALISEYVSDFCFALFFVRVIGFNSNYGARSQATKSVISAHLVLDVHDSCNLGGAHMRSLVLLASCMSQRYVVGPQKLCKAVTKRVR